MTNQPPPTAQRPPLPKPNPVTQAAHRREVLRQVTIPFVFFLLAIVVLIGVLVTNGIGTAESWAQISTIFLILPLLILALIALGIVGAAVYAITQLLSLLPPYARLTQQAITRLEEQIESGADISVEPLLQIKSFLAMADTLFGRNKKNNE